MNNGVFVVGRLRLPDLAKWKVVDAETAKTAIVDDVGDFGEALADGFDDEWTVESVLATAKEALTSGEAYLAFDESDGAEVRVQGLLGWEAADEQWLHTLAFLVAGAAAAGGAGEIRFLPVGGDDYKHLAIQDGRAAFLLYGADDVAESTVQGWFTIPEATIKSDYEKWEARA